MKRLKFRCVASMAAAVLIAVGAAKAPAVDSSDQLVAGSKALSYVGDQPSQVVTVSYVGDIPCDGCDAGSCDSAGCSGNGCSGGEGDGCGFSRGYGQPDLFYNFYTQGYSNRTNAQMYLSPLPVPPNVGQSYFTYQPFYPHEMLYWHRDKFHNYYDNGRGMNRTRAVYFSPPIRQAVSNFYWNKIRLPR